MIREVGLQGPLRKKNLKLSNAFKDHEWYLTRDDKDVLPKFSIYPWMENKKWYSKTRSKKYYVQKIITPM
jgi:hypothetical protein